MASRLQNQSFNIDFIDENPAIAAYQKAQKFDQEQRSGELDIAGKQRTNDFNRSADPDRLRKLGAETSSTESQADVDYRTRDNKVAASNANASIAGTNASTAAAEAPFKIDQTQSGARTARAGADVATATVPVKIEEEGTRLRQQRATAVNTEMQGFYKSLELLNAGDVEGAKEAARSVGHDIPDAVINDARVRSVVTSAAARAKELYPDRPANQQAYISAQLTEVQRRVAEGQPNDRYTSYTMPPGAPAPVESAGTSAYELLPGKKTDENGNPIEGVFQHDKRSGDINFRAGETISSKSGGSSSGTERIIADLRRENPTLSYADALAIVKKSGQSPDVLSIRKEGLALSAAKADTAYLTNPTATIEKYRKQYGLTSPSSPSAPQSRTPAPPAPPAAPKSGSGLPPAASITGTQSVDLPSDMAGSGTRASPFVANSQAHIDWFKNNAPADAVIIVNGQPYTK